MSARMNSPVLFALAVLVLFACDNGSPPKAGTESAVALPEDNTAPTNFSAGRKSVAEKVVAQSAGVSDGDLVLILGSDEDLQLLEDIAVEVRKRGASPLVSVGTERLNRRLYDEVPAKYDSREPEMIMKLAGIVDVVINTESAEGRTLEGVAPERIAARGKAFTPVAQLMQKRGVRVVALGNGLYPTAERAEQFGVSREDLAGMMYGGVDVDYPALQATGEQVR
jgi:leucyl aminopeptidase (aminopeptidase T)